jgi:DNA-binding MarR family transcriptional regulator
MPDPTPWLTEEQQRVWRQWLGVQAQLPAALNRQLQTDHQLSLQDFEVLVHLSETPQGRLRISALAEELQWEQSRLSHHLRRMERRDLVCREPCPADARGFFAVLTESGRGRLVAAAPSHVMTVRQHLFDQLTAGQLAALDEITLVILNSLAAGHG